MLIAAVITLAVLVAGFAATSVALAVKLSKAIEQKARLSGDIVALQATKQQSEAQLQQIARDKIDSDKRHELQLVALRADISGLEADLESCSSPDARRARLNRLLEKASPRTTNLRGAGENLLHLRPTP